MKNGKEMRSIKFLIVFLLLVVAIASLVGCKKESQDERQIAEKVEPPPVKITPKEDIRQRTAWPPDIGTQEVLLEENLLQQNYYLVFDGSGSMEGQKLDIAKKALNEFVKSIPVEANIGLVVFDGSGLSERTALGENRELFINNVQKVTANGGTPLRDAIILAYRQLKEQGLKQLGYGEYNLVIITDGQASDGQEPKEIVNRILKESPLVIHTIGFKIGTKHSLNQPGRILYKSANNFEELKRGLESVLAELEDFSVTDFQE